MNLSLTGKRALVGGSSQGIGKASAIELSKLGASVVLMARNESTLKSTLLELDYSFDQKHSYIIADFSNPESLKNSVELEIIKNGAFDILINNTGGPAAGPILNAKTDEFLMAFNNHLICNHILAQAIIPNMKEKGFGRIVNVISTSVKVPLKGLGVSNTIRAAVANWSKTLSIELAPFGITVNNVLPGATKTDRLTSIIDNKANKLNIDKNHVEQEMLAEIPAGRFGLAEEIAAAIAFLATPAAAYINGINIPVDGGRTGSL